MKTEFEKSLRQVRLQLKKMTDEKQKELLRKELHELKEMVKNNKSFS